MRERETTVQLKMGKSYTRRELLSVLSSDTKVLKESSFQWKLGDYLKSGSLVKTGYDEYRVPGATTKTGYQPQYSELAANIIAILSDAYPFVSFTVFETVLMNEFLNHLIAQNTIFVQVEKESSSFVFRALQEAGYQNVMYKPSAKDRALYWVKNCIIVTDMISEAPCDRQHPHFITLEKMLVDMYCDKFIEGTYSSAEFPNVLRVAAERYLLDRTRMLRYARRRNKEKELRSILGEIGQ